MGLQFCVLLGQCTYFPWRDPAQEGGVLQADMIRVPDFLRDRSDEIIS